MEKNISRLPNLEVGKPAYFDTFLGLVKCEVLEIDGSSPCATSRVKVKIRITEDKKGDCCIIYHKGEIFVRDSLSVVPCNAIVRRGCYERIGHYTVNQPSQTGSIS